MLYQFTDVQDGGQIIRENVRQRMGEEMLVEEKYGPSY